MNEEIAESLDIILDKEKSDIDNNIENSDMISEDLIIIFQTIDDNNGKDEYIRFLEGIFIEQWIHTLSIFKLFFKLWKKDSIINCLRKTIYSVNITLSMVLNEYYDYFSKSDLGVLLESINNSISGYNSSVDNKIYEWIVEEIRNLRYEKLKKTLNFHSVEIDNDQKEVEKLLKDFWFDKKYNQSLELVDKYFWNEELDDTVIPGWIIWIYRQFFDDFYMDIALKAAKVNWLKGIPEDISPEKTSKFWHALAYISREFWISKDEEHLLKGHYWVTNSEWAHKLLSNKKYFRLVKNISIEIALFMLTKLEDYKKEKE